jgi:uncharacterized membrane protein
MSKKSLNVKPQPKVEERQIIATQQYSGPIPDPESLARYESVIPGAAERILKMAENEAKHRHAIDNRLTKHSAITTYLGMIFAFSSVAILAGVVVLALFRGQSNAAIAMAITAIASVAGVFIIYKRNKKK